MNFDCPIRKVEIIAATSLREFKTVSQYFTNMRTAIDVGGHVGTWAMHLVNVFEKLYIIEPIPTNIQFLTQHFSDNNVTVIPGAASNYRGFLPFTVCVDVNMACSGLAREKLLTEKRETRDFIAETFLLDDVIPTYTPIDFIKIDADGHDLKVLQGAERIIKLHKPLIYVEVKYQKEEIREFLKEQEYELIKQIRNNDLWKIK